MRGTVKRIASLMAVGLALAGCFSFSGKRSTDEYKYIDDLVVTSRIEGFLKNQGGDALAGVKVDTHQGVVHLTGKVKSLEEKAKAGRIAQELEGVKKVQNDLAVEGENSDAAGER